jgi:hypothetical protein
VRPGYLGVAMTATQRHDELYTIWSAARAEANLAYEAWCDLPGSDSYSVYRAAEDRADAAEQALAHVGSLMLAA